MQVCNVSARDLFAYESMDLNLEDRGLVLVDGENGAGKSSILKVISWALFNDPLTDQRADEVIRHREDGTYVTGKSKACVSLRAADQLVEVSRYRKHHKHQNKVLLSVGGKDITGASNAATFAQIRELLQMDATVFKSAVLYPQRTDGFVELAEGEQKQVFDSLLDLGRFGDARKAAREEQQKIKGLLQKYQSRLSETETRVTDSNTRIGEYELAHQQFAAQTQTTLQELNTKLNKLSSEMPTLPGNLEEDIRILQERSGEWVAAIKAEQQLSNQLTGLYAEANVLRQNISAYEQQLATLPEAPPPPPEYPEEKYTEEIERANESRGVARAHKLNAEAEIADCMQAIAARDSTDTCDRCGQVLSAEAKQRLFGDLEHDLEQARLTVQASDQEDQALHVLIESSARCLKEARSYKEWERLSAFRETLAIQQHRFTEIAKQVQAAEAQLPQVTEAATTAREQQTALSTLQQQKQAIELDIAKRASEAQTVKAEISAVESKESPYPSLIAREQTTSMKLSSSAHQYREIVSRLEDSLRYYHWWVEGFGNAGVKMWLVQQALPFLNQRFGEYLTTLTAGKAAGQFALQDKRADGSPVDRFHAQVKYRGGTIRDVSGGEQQRVNIAAMFALGDLGAMRARSPIRLRVLDEPFDGLDAFGKELVVQTLKEHIVPRAGTVLVMSHDDSLKQKFSHHIHVHRVGPENVSAISG